jgi:hypothetical protein
MKRRASGKRKQLEPREKKMAEQKGKKDTEQAAEPVAPASGKTQSLGIRLAAVENSDQPVFANYTSLNVAPGTVFIDFGFLEPGMLTALPRVARQGGKLPESINGKLAVRVALGYDTLQGLKQQIDRLVQSAQKKA